MQRLSVAIILASLAATASIHSVNAQGGGGGGGGTAGASSGTAPGAGSAAADRGFDAANGGTKASSSQPDSLDKPVKPRPCSTAARETDGTTTCIGVPAR